MPDDGPIILSTFGSLIRHGFEMSIHCWRCRRWADIGLAAFPPAMSYIGRRFGCACGERGRLAAAASGL